MRGPSKRQAVAPERSPIVGLADFEHCFEVNFVTVHRFIARRVGTPLAGDLAAETFATAFDAGTVTTPGWGLPEAGFWA